MPYPRKSRHSSPHSLSRERDRRLLFRKGDRAVHNENGKEGVMVSDYIEGYHPMNLSGKFKWDDGTISQISLGLVTKITTQVVK